MSWGCHSTADLSNAYKIDHEKLINLLVNTLRNLYRHTTTIFPNFLIEMGVNLELPIRNRGDREEPLLLLLSEIFDSGGIGN